MTRDIKKYVLDPTKKAERDQLYDSLFEIVSRYDCLSLREIDYVLNLLRHVVLQQRKEKVRTELFSSRNVSSTEQFRNDIIQKLSDGGLMK